MGGSLGISRAADGSLRVAASGTFVAKSSGGLDGDWTCRKILAEPIHTQRPTVFIRGGKRTLAPCLRWGQYGENSWLWGGGTFYSDDDGLTWKLSNFVSAPLHVPNEIDQGPRTTAARACRYPPSANYTFWIGAKNSSLSLRPQDCLLFTTELV